MTTSSSTLATQPGPSVLGPRGRRLIRAMSRLANPLIRLAAGRRWMRIVGVLHHQGRRSGRMYATPVGIRRFRGGFVVPLTFGDKSHWYQNVMTAGGGVVSYGGADQEVDRPEVVDWATASVAFPRYERLLFRAIGIYQFLCLQSKPEQTPGVRGGPSATIGA